MKAKLHFTLVEIALAALILGVGLTCILSIFPAAIRWGGSASDASNGSMAAQSALTVIRRKMLEANDSYSEIPGVPVNSGDHADMTFGKYICSIATGEKAVSGLAYLHSITIHVYGTDYTRLPSGTPARMEAEKDLVFITKAYVYDPD
ncbi:MAG: type IV pilus modification PilV family protein [Planctomycetota bacterium]